MKTMKNEGPVAQGTRHRKPWKLMLAGAFIACAFGALVIRTAWATAGKDISSTTLAGPILLGEVVVKSESEINEVEIKTKGLSDVWVVNNVVKPGGNSGWHSHPGPSIISVVSGQATEYRDDDPIGTDHPAGTAFVDEGGDHAHIVVNEGDTDLVLVAFQILPFGAPRRIDEPAP